MLTQASLLPVERQVRIVAESLAEDALDFMFEQSSTTSAIAIGDSREVLRRLPPNIFQTCVTSPPTGR